ncbi:MAG: lipopolysaccharide kinase InaA family protein [Planctomycetota bacterium]|jgi:hypothetical protein|nr:lipopolysaccharide kinase InaA family protein [Planctomycetota bacterium]
MSNPPPLHFSADGRPIAEELGIDGLDSAFELQGDLLRKAENRTTLKVLSRSGPVILKRYDATKGPWPLWGPSSAQREWDTLQALNDLGFPVPTPLGWGSERRQGGRSFLMMGYLPGKDMKSLLLDNTTASWRNEMPERLGELTRRFHGLGFFHRDYYLNHFLLDLSSPEFTLNMLDLQRVGRGRPPRKRWFVKDLASLASSCPSSVRQTERLRFLLAYFGKKKVDSEVRSWIAPILKKEALIRNHLPKFP